MSAEQRRLANFLDFIGEGRGSQALGKAPIETERRAESLTDEVDTLRRGQEKVFAPPPTEWIEHRLSNLSDVLERRTARPAKVQREVLGAIRLDPSDAGYRPPVLQGVNHSGPVGADRNTHRPGRCGDWFDFIA